MFKAFYSVLPDKLRESTNYWREQSCKLSAASMLGGVQCNRYCLAKVAGFEPTALRRQSFWPQASFLARRSLNASGTFVSTDGNRLIGSNLVHSSIPEPRTACEGMADKNIEGNDVFVGLGGESEAPVKICQTHTLPAALTIAEAVTTLQSAVKDLKSSPPTFESGILRFQVPLPQDIKALDWLHCQPQSCRLYPRCYFSPKSYEGSIVESTSTYGIDKDMERLHKNIARGVAGVGSAVLFKNFHHFSIKDWKAIRRFLSVDSPLIRAYGSIRFNSETEPAIEWLEFGSFYFVIPQIELDEFENYTILAATIAWDHSLSRAFEDSIIALELSLQQVSCQVMETGKRLHLSRIKKSCAPDELFWEAAIEELSKMSGSNFSKVVLARRTQISTETDIDCLELMAFLQEKDHFFQFFIQLSNSTTFMGNTPQQLLHRNGLLVSTEVISRSYSQRHTLIKNPQKGSSFLQWSSSDLENHCSFEIMEEAMKSQMELICKHVRVGAKFALLSLLHQNAADCGHPIEAAEIFKKQIDTFDQGLYGGPVGWFGGKDAEFALATGSVLVQKNIGTKIFLYSEAELQKDDQSSSIWCKHELMASQFEALLEPYPQLQQFANINALWAYLMVEECCRLGITYFCIAPGSRSSALAVAAAQNPHALCISCIDERSLAFHALGYARGSHKPAAVITSSGTAISNLFPAVVEASQDCIPLLLLTADRPPELHDTGANQTINQVNHFGSFVRYFYNLAPPDDQVPARMVLTTIDTAVFRATGVPYGPVHINCAFREPLAGICCEWSLRCLKDLDRWMSKSGPFTKYMQVLQLDYSEKLIDVRDRYKEVVDLIQGASRGILILGDLKTAEETWAALLLGRHLGWPIVPDVLSGLRLRKLASTIAEGEMNLLFIDFLDHVLLSSSVRRWMSPDVVLQVGSRLTSKRIAKLLEDCRPDVYIMVANHPYRHDPSHILTHRIQASVVGFAAAIRELHVPKGMASWSKWLKVLNDMVGWEISFQLNAEPLLTEPFVSRAVSQFLSPGSAFFLGNSMAIRNADMYGLGWSKLPISFAHDMLDPLLPFLGLKVAGNRGASGIDGVLSTAIGYAAGSNRRVVFMVGDISFLHDTNGLTFSKERIGRPPITVVVTNNHGGGIFSLLPIADTAPRTVFRNFFSTPHDVSISKLCLAHRVNHMLVRTKEELESALLISQEGKLDWVIEVDSNIEENITHHRVIQQSALQVAEHAFNILSRYSEYTDMEINTSEICVLKMEYSRYRIPLFAPLTTASKKNQSEETYREGFLLTLILYNGNKGYGEVAPVGPNSEDMLDVEEQLRFLAYRTHNMSLGFLMSLLNDTFSGWIWRDIGIPACSLFPSVRCGLEMGVLSALAATRGGNIADLLLGTKNLQNVLGKQESPYISRNLSSKVQICALLDSDDPPEEVALAAAKLVEQGFHTVKLKVARRSEPLEDAAVIRAVRQKVGHLIEIRVDANRKWTFSQAMQFATGVKDCNLQYIEEPVQHPGDIIRFCDESNMFVALDETIDDIKDHLLDRLSIFAHPRIVATVMKPARLGGFERVALIAKWANKHGKMAVVSAAFESSVSLSVYVQFACFIDNRNIGIRASDKTKTPRIAHGLGTYSWLRDDVMKEKLQFQVYPEGDRIEVDVNDAATILQNMVVNPDTVNPSCVGAKIKSYKMAVLYNDACFSFHVMDTGINDQTEKTVLFLHGFLGTGKDWLPIMEALSISVRCISIDLPGHGKTSVQKDCNTFQNNGNAQILSSEVNNQSNLTERNFSIEYLSEVLSELICQITEKKVVLIGYSMGARIALYMTLKCNKRISATAVISGNPGLQNPDMRITRSAQDDALAELLLSTGIPSFVEMWYKKEMWESLRSHPHFKKLIQRRIQHGNIKDMAKMLSSLSIGRQPSLWQDLSGCKVPLLVIVGEKDSKFMKIAQQMSSQKADTQEHEKQREDQFHQITVLEVDESGHAVLFENPLPVINAIRKFVM
ncbi:protein PHYLLO, chloroplastic isoform X2 [Cryptomeria japonica]|uniref:protein PHYLLO, chloroplastic isoform X2 n=1 Tax=Cryptomeria japonica TaxID=3369 RepID=UPI0027DA8637|nr:protein PHYLLO, chloroplastic isoform X2 [Cryptomeria japonica]